MRPAKLVAAIAEATTPLPNSVAWPEIVARLQAAGCSAKVAHDLRGRAWLARKKLRKASLASIDAKAHQQIEAEVPQTDNATPQQRALQTRDIVAKKVGVGQHTIRPYACSNVH
jgi:hypothetical protein